MKTNPITHRRHYVITYDVSDDKRRNRIFKTLYDVLSYLFFFVYFHMFSWTPLYICVYTRVAE